MQLLDNITWHTLTGTQARFATGDGLARRYAPGYSGIIGFADLTRPDFDALAPYCVSGERFYIAGWTGPLPAGWTMEFEGVVDQMVWTEPPPAIDTSRPAVPLDVQHLPQILELVGVTHPGPFGPKTIELGEYFGYFEGSRLIAMAGERQHAAPFREISGVCTHPDFQGQGLARRLMEVLLTLQLHRGETPFLHVMQQNLGAVALYQRMGFRRHKLRAIRVLRKA